MSGREQRRAWVLSRVEAGEMSTAEAAQLLVTTTALALETCVTVGACHR